LRGKQTDYKVYDIHAHIIPGVDDGAENFNMAMNVVYMAYLQGTKNIVCTSHDGYNTKKYFRNLKVLQRQIDKANLGVTLHPGCEIYCCFDDMDDIVADLKNKTIPTINGTEYVLVEFSPYANVSEMIYCLKYLHEFGYKTIIAHVERYRVLHTSSQWITLMQRMGCLFQVNAYSFVDTEDKAIKVFAQNLLKEKRISFIGSDTHGTDYRPYAVQNGVDYIYKNCDVEYAKDICYRNAKNMLNMK
jgi:protein-tyrosine phosphatase